MLGLNLRDYKKVYKNDIWKYIDRHKDCVWTVEGSLDNSITHMTHRAITDYLIRKSLSNGHIDRKKGVLVLDVHMHKSKDVEQYILTPKKVNRIIC
jgi:hypothetical protein